MRSLPEEWRRRIASESATPTTLAGYADRNKRNGVGQFDSAVCKAAFKLRAATVAVLVWDLSTADAKQESCDFALVARVRLSRWVKGFPVALENLNGLDLVRSQVCLHSVNS